MAKTRFQWTEEQKRQISKKLFGRKKSEETRLRMSIAQKSLKKKLSNETKSKLRLANLGKKITESVRTKISKGLKGIKRSPETIAKMCIAQKGRICTEQQKERQRAAMLGKKHSEETKNKMSLMRQGENSANWKGGITPLYLHIRHHFNMGEWISKCFYRDNFTCQECGVRGGKLNCHHVKYFSEIVEEYSIENIEDALKCSELWDINNGVTLCRECHILMHKKNV